MTLIYDFDKWGTYTCCFKKCCFSLTNSDPDQWLENEAKKRRAWFKKKYLKKNNRDCINEYFDAIGNDRRCEDKPEDDREGDEETGDAKTGANRIAGTCC